MTTKRRTRRALINSVISLIICFSMLIGTTFAWFTDSVVTGMNTIQAGNLDIELYANGNKVDSNTKLFDDVTNWEPGVAVYENLKIKNEGSLALKYQMSLNFGNENNLNGHKLSEVLKVAKVDKIEDGATRYEILEAAKAVFNQGKGTLSNFYEIGNLEVETNNEEEFAIIIFWDPSTNEIDNLYNANNDQTTSDGEKLHIEFGINLMATQQMSENDSFGKDYDEFASILPKATVNNTGAQTVPVFAGYDEENIALDTSFQFLPNEKVDEETQTLDSAYRYWHADYVVSANKDVPANSMALAGYYKAFCGDNGWVVMTSDEKIPANTEIRLVELLGATVNYEEICQYGNDGIGFLCGASDLSGANAGTTITVELRLYETTKDPNATSGTANDETGNYEVIGKYSYTFGAAELPDAIVTDLGAQTVPVFRGYDESEIALDTTFQLKPTESEDVVASSPYRYWHADFVVKTDKDVPANTMALAGYYDAWCGNNGWVVMTSENPIAAGTEIRLLGDGLGVTMNYEEISQLMNDGTGFLCGAADIDGVNVGTTLTAELRLYETTIDPENPSGTANDETGEYVVAGTYTYTF